MSEEHLATLQEDEAGRDEAAMSVNDSSFDRSTDVEELYFCKLARRPTGDVDPLWKKVMMATNDEINAHTILFMPGPHYDDLIERLVAKIAGWVLDTERSL